MNLRQEPMYIKINIQMKLTSKKIKLSCRHKLVVYDYDRFVRFPKIVNSITGHFMIKTVTGS